MARNIEVLRNYFLGKDPQLKEILADNSLRLCGIAGRHYVLRSELIARLEELKKYVDDADEELQEAIDEVIQDLGSEATLRANSDLALQNNINSEASTRQGADNQLSGRITTNANDILALNTWKNTTDFVLDDDLIEALGNYYTKPEINQMISVLPRFSIEVVQTLPTQDISETTIYLVPSSNPELRNSYDEFIYVSNNWEQIGTTAIDLSGYYTKTETDTLLSGKQGTLTPGNNVSINNNVISATDTTYSAGDNIDITNNNISTIGDTITKLEDGTKIWDLDTGIYGSDEQIHLYFDAAGTARDLFKGILFVYDNSVTGRKSWYFFGDQVMYYGWVTSTQFYKGGMDVTFNYEDKSNKVNSLSSSSTNVQYPGAKAVYDAIQSSRGIKEINSTSYISNLDSGAYLVKGADGVSLGIYSHTNGDLIYTASTQAVRGPYSSAILLVEEKVVADMPPFVTGSTTKRYTLFDNDNGIKYGDVVSTDSLATWTHTGGTIKYSELSTFGGATSSTNGKAGIVPAPTTADTGKFLSADGTWQNAGGGSTITYGDTDLTPGVSPLADGEFYFVYE